MLTKKQADDYFAWRARYEKDGERWITINGGDGGGTPVKVDGDGNIVAGPKGLADKGIKKLGDFGGGAGDAEAPAGKPKDGETKKSKDGTTWAKAPKGGGVSPVNGEFYKGGQWMPIHGLSTPQEKKPPKPPQGGEVGKPNEDAKKKDQRTPKPPEDIEAEKSRREAAKKQSEIDDGPLRAAGFDWNGRHSWRVKQSWAPFAEQIGDDKLKEITKAFKPTDEFDLAEFNDLVDHPQGVKGILPKKHHKDLPSSAEAYHSLLMASEKASGIDERHALHQKLQGILDGQAKVDEPAPPKPASTQTGLFGRVAQPTKGTFDESQNTGTGKQGTLFSKKGLKGQNNLFDDIGIEGKKVDYSKPVQQRYEADARWITIGAGKEGGGTPIKIDGEGNILAGPKAIKNRGISNLSHFGDEEAQDKNRANAESEGRKKRMADRGGKEKWSPKDHLEHAVDGAIERNPHLKESALRSAIDDVWAMSRDEQANRESIKKRAREMAGINAGTISRMENAGLDRATLGKLDTVARDLVEEYPDMEGEFGGDDAPERLWEFIKEGRKALPAKHDEAIVERAVELLDSNVAEFSSHLESVPFQRTGYIEKYAEYLRLLARQTV